LIWSILTLFSPINWSFFHAVLHFSKLELIHDTVIGLLINKVDFGRDIYV
jgi:hypothetical protein